MCTWHYSMTDGPCFIVRINSADETIDHFHKLDVKDQKTPHKTIAVAYALAATCPPACKPEISVQGVTYKIRFVPRNRSQLPIDPNESDKSVIAFKETLTSLTATILARAVSTVPYELEAIVSNTKIANFIRTLSEAKFNDRVVCEAHSTQGVTVIESIDPALLPGKKLKNPGRLEGPFPISAIGRNWKLGVLELYLSTQIVVPLPDKPGFGPDDVRPAFDSRWALNGHIHENRESGRWEVDDDAKLLPIQNDDLFGSDELS